jgi:hypothetical protein
VMQASRIADAVYRADLRIGLRNAEKAHNRTLRLLVIITKAGGEPTFTKRELLFWETQILSLKRKMKED